MKLIFLVIGIILLTTVVFIIWRLFQTPNARNSSVDLVPVSNSKSPEPDNPYLELRSQALEFPPEQFGLDSASKTPVTYGVVMDWNMGSGTATFVAFSSGDASMYTSSGGGMIGGGGREKVSTTAKAFVTKAAGYVTKAERSDDIALPVENEVKFFILTTQGRFVAKDKLKNLDNETSALLDLFIEANYFISEMRAVSEANQK